MEIIIQKRDGRQVPFDRQKIVKAVLAAFKDVEGDISNYAIEKADNIADYVEQYCQAAEEPITVEDIQDLVERGLMSTKAKKVAQTYIRYRYKKEVARESASDFFDAVKEKLQATNVQNQNANVDESTFGGRTGEASDVMTRKMALDYLVSDMAKNNHLNNEIYIHDLNSYYVGSHNCFDRNTAFITAKGIKTFKDFKENDVVTVLSPFGGWVSGVVKKYEAQPLNTYTLKKNKTEIKVKATPNHRWLMKDGSFQEGLKIGDRLFDSPYFWKDFRFKDLSPEGKKYWCYGFVMGDGTLEAACPKQSKKYYKPDTSKVKLCGEKVKFLSYFQECGWEINCRATEPEIRGIPFNRVFPDFDSLSIEYLIAFIHGLYEAAGTKALATSTGKQIYSIQFSDKTYCEFVEKYFEVAGLYISSIKDKTRQKTSSGTRKFIKNYQFTAEPSARFQWYVKDILFGKEITNVWCLEVEEGHAFTLAGGIPTGNCLTCPLDDLLAKGFNTRQTDIRPAGSINTAFQLVAVLFQLQSLCQFGGVAASHLDWTMVPYVRKSFYTHYTEGLKYTDPTHPKLEITKNEATEISIEDETVYSSLLARGFALDMTLQELKQAVEGLFHNLNSLQSRSGCQLPFSSINFGSCTLPEGRMVIKALLEGSLAGIGALHRTPIFPCSIFQLGEGINRKPGDPNYDLFQLALKSTALRLYPNYANLDWSGNAGYDPNDPKTYFSTINKTVA